MTLDSVVDTVIPWVIGIIGIYILYKPLKKPLSGLGGAIKNLISGIKSKTERVAENSYSNLGEITYE